MLPLFDIEPANIVPSTFHIFIDVVSNSLNTLVNIEKDYGRLNSTLVIKKFENILAKKEIDKKA